MAKIAPYPIRKRISAFCFALALPYLFDIPVFTKAENAAPSYQQLISQIIDKNATDTDVPNSLKQKLIRQANLSMVKGKKDSANFSNGKASIEISKPENKPYTNYNPSGMYFTAHKIDLNDDNRPELEVTYQGSAAAALNWPLWFFSMQDGKYTPILKATVNNNSYCVLSPINHGYHDVITVKSVIDDPHKPHKDEYSVYTFDGTKYVITHRLITASD